ncbi:MAG: UbiA-like polyprenyltransferase [Pirellulaceae bacterium]
MLTRLRHLLEMIRFSHTVFALPFALLAAVMAWTARGAEGETVPFNGWHLLGIVVCMVTARSAAMAFNRLADRRIDAGNPRTAKRHLPAGVLSVQSVVAFTIAASLAFIASTLLFLPNVLPIALSIPVLGFLLAYSYTKRFTSLAHFWLGASLMLAPVSTWIALRGQVVMQHPADLLPSLILGVAVLLWVSGFDIIYACQDIGFDIQSKLRSVPAALGVVAALRLAAGCHLAMIAVLAALPYSQQFGGPELDLGWIYWAGVAAVAALLVYEHAIVRADDLTRVNIAFFNVNAIVSIGLFVVVTLDLLT